MIDWKKVEMDITNLPPSELAKQSIKNMLRRGLLPKEWLDKDGNLIKIKDRN